MSSSTTLKLKQPWNLMLMICILDLTQFSVANKFDDCIFECQVFNCLTSSAGKVTCHGEKWRRMPLVENGKENLIRYENVKEFRVTRGELETISKEAFPLMRNLDIVDFSRNNLNTFDIPLYIHLGNLKKIILERNQIKAVIGSFKGPITETMETLNLSHNRLGYFPLHNFVKLQALLHIRFDHNKISSIPREAFKHARFPRLKYLRLNNNRIKSIGHHAFAGLLRYDQDEYMELYVQPARYPHTNAIEGWRHSFIDIRRSRYDCKSCSQKGYCHYNCICSCSTVSYCKCKWGFSGDGRSCFKHRPGKLTSWSRWSKCSASCGRKGNQERVRNCLLGYDANCRQKTREKRSCKGHPCPRVEWFSRASLSVTINGQSLSQWTRRNRRIKAKPLLVKRKPVIRKAKAETSDKNKRSQGRKISSGKERMKVNKKIKFDDTERLMKIINSHAPFVQSLLTGYISSLVFTQLLFYIWLLFHRRTKKRDLILWP